MSSTVEGGVGLHPIDDSCLFTSLLLLSALMELIQFDEVWCAVDIKLGVWTHAHTPMHVSLLDLVSIAISLCNKRSKQQSKTPKILIMQ